MAVRTLLVMVTMPDGKLKIPTVTDEVATALAAVVSPTVISLVASPLMDAPWALKTVEVKVLLVRVTVDAVILRLAHVRLLPAEALTCPPSAIETGAVKAVFVFAAISMIPPPEIEKGSELAIEPPVAMNKEDWMLMMTCTVMAAAKVRLAPALTSIVPPPLKVRTVAKVLTDPLMSATAELGPILKFLTLGPSMSATRISSTTLLMEAEEDVREYVPTVNTRPLP